MNFIIWWLLCFITIGIYVFWLVPKVNNWIAENTFLEDSNNFEYTVVEEM